MAIPSFYHSDLTEQNSVINLEANEASHAVRARRLRVGQEVRVFNGIGLLAFGFISAVERRDVVITLNSFELAPINGKSISIAVAMPKGDRQKVMVDMLTQLGVVEIIPLRCERSVAKFNHNTAEKWRRVAIEACKQSQNPWLPNIGDEIAIEELLSRGDRDIVFANADGREPKKIIKESSNLTVIIGPEGGFTDVEFATLSQYSIPSLSVGPYILRTEAAAIAVASALISKL